MALDNIKRKIEADKKAKPYTRRTVIIGPGGKTQEVTEHISFEEWLKDQEEDEWYPNPEDPGGDESQW